MSHITASLAGKTIKMALKDERHLILVCTDGHEFKIGWRHGEPYLYSVGVKVTLPNPSQALSAGLGVLG